MKFRNKPVEVDAFQWFPPGDERHVPINGVVHRPPTILFSIDESYYYVTGSDQLSTMWLSVKKYTPDECAAFKSNGLDGLMGFDHAGEKYGRHVLPFALYSVKSGEEKPVDRASDLYLDFGSAEKWKSHPLGHAYIETPGGRKSVKPGDWIAIGADGVMSSYMPEGFAATFEPVGP